MRVAPPYLYTKQGRVWLQRTELSRYFLLDNHGITNMNWPASGPTQIRAQSTSARAGQQTVAVTQGDKDLAQFSIPTFLREASNYLLAIEDEYVNVQVHTGSAGQPSQYDGANYGLAWVFALRQTGSTPGAALADNSGEGAQIGQEFPFAAVIGPVVIDWTAALARRTSVATQVARDIFTLPVLKDQDHSRRVLPGEVGMIVHDSAVGPALAELFYFTDGWRSAPTACAADPFPAGVGCMSVVGYGDKRVNRFIVSAETQAGAAPAGAYTNDFGTTWTNFNFGAVNADEATRLWVVHAGRVYGCGGQAASSKIWLSTDGGASWTENDPALAQPLKDICVGGDGIGYAVGASNTIAKITNFDSIAAATGPAGGAGDDLLCVAIKPTTGAVFIGNDAGELYCSQDGAATWRDMTTSMQGVGAVASVNHIGFDVTGEFGFMEVTTSTPDERLLRTTDGGATWLPRGLGVPVTNIVKNGLHVYGPNDVWLVGALSGGTAVVEEVTTDFDGKRWV